MPVRLTTGQERFGFEALLIENDLLRIEVLPELGGKIWSIAYKPRDRELLWHHPSIVPQRVELGSSFDDAFSGGWDELFPNDAPVTIDGIAYPDHGEIWTANCAWDVINSSESEVTIALTCRGSATGALVEKQLTLRAGEASLHVSYSARNDSEHALKFHWKLHPALRMGPNARIDIPAANVIFDPEFAEEFGIQEGNWPIVRGNDGEKIDLRIAPRPESKATRFFYATELREGWCAMTDLDDGIGVRFDFDRAIFSAVTVFGTYGGWRNLHTTILEPCTGYPYQLDRAIESGRATSLLTGGTFQTTVMMSVHTIDV
ncbi:hypothetical protein BH09CHL1_BH09CHL1_07720 [soil metagenome]